MRPDGLVSKTESGKKERRVVGIKTFKTKVLDTDIVILAIGAWTISSHGA